MAGLDPATSYPFSVRVGDKSCQSGFEPSISATFQARDQCLMFFSRWIAAMLWWRSTWTSASRF